LSKNEPRVLIKKCNKTKIVREAGSKLRLKRELFLWFKYIWWRYF